MTSPHTAETFDDDAIVPPILVKIAAGALGVSAGFAVMLGAQLLLAVGRPNTVLTVAIVLYFVGGLGGLAVAVQLARARTWAAFTGLALGLALAALACLPFFYGIVALTPFLTAGAGFIGAVLSALSIPASARVSRARAALLDV